MAQVVTASATALVLVASPMLLCCVHRGGQEDYERQLRMHVETVQERETQLQLLQREHAAQLQETVEEHEQKLQEHRCEHEEVIRIAEAKHEAAMAEHEAQASRHRHTLAQLSAENEGTVAAAQNKARASEHKAQAQASELIHAVRETGYSTPCTTVPRDLLPVVVHMGTKFSRSSDSMHSDRGPGTTVPTTDRGAARWTAVLYASPGGSGRKRPSPA
eukprot:SAG11_NODE_285_length_11230_cov_6.339412_5_plen_218_part_00